MAYDKHTWTCDEPITVERLNHIEDGIANAGGDDCGFECEEGMVTLTEESVTTTKGKDDDYANGELSYSEIMDAETIIVTFDGTEYECDLINLDGNNGYGGWDTSTFEFDFSQYPFAIESGEGVTSIYNDIYTSTPGTHSIKIEVAGDMTVTTTPCFEKAVQSIVNPLIVKASRAPSEGTSNAQSILDASPSTIQDAMKTRGVVVEDPYGNLYSVLYATDREVTIVASQYNQTATPPTVLQPYMYTYQNSSLRYPQQGTA